MKLHPARFLVPLLIALAVGGNVPAHAATPAPTGQQDTSRPLAMHEARQQTEQQHPTISGPFEQQKRLAAAAPFAASTDRAGTAGAANSGLKREVFGFVNAGNLGDAGFGYPSWQFSVLSTVAYFGIDVDPWSGALIQSGTGWSVWNSSTNSSFISRAHSNGTRVVLSIDLHDFSSGSPAICAGLTHAATTISQTLSQVQAKGVDGVNVDYEGLNGSCGTADPNAARNRMTDFMRQLRAAMPSYYIAIDTYAASASDPFNFFNVAGMAPYVDSDFVMAYDSDQSNWYHLGCSSYCLNAVSPTGGSYFYNDTRAAREYSSAIPASKVILGLPYYGRKACVPATVGPNEGPNPANSLSSPTYTYASTAAQSTGVSSFVAHVDNHDPTEEYDTFYSSTYGCWREQYWENVNSLGAKYDVINSYNLRGAGIFTLDYGGGAQELWNSLATHFSLIPGAPGSVAACPVTGALSVSWTAAPSAAGVSGYTVTASPGGASVSVGPSATFATVGGLTPGTAYTLTVTPRNGYGAGIASTTGAMAPYGSPPAHSSYFSWYDLASPGMSVDNIHLYNPDAAQTATGCVIVDGVRLVPISIGPRQAQGVSFFAGDIGGPISVNIYSGPAVEASQRVKYYQSFNEVAALPLASASTSLWFPWYDRVSSPGFYADNIHVINPGNATANVTVNIPRCGPQTAPIGPGSYQVFSCNGFGGPVSVTSNVPVLASQRVQFYNSFNEVAAQPSGAAVTAQLFTWFDRVSNATFVAGQDNIHVVNPGPSAATVTVAIPGCGPQAQSIAAAAAAYFTCASGFGGPVNVTSNNPILASQRVAYAQSFNEVAGMALAAASPSAHFSWFDRISDIGFVAGADNIHVVDPPGAPPSAFTVTIPGCSPMSGSLSSGQEAVFSCPSGYGGPVSVVAGSGAILASQRVQYYQSFNEIPAQSP